MTTNITALPLYKKSTNLVCPADIKPLYDQAVAKGTKFTDNEFPAEQKSIGDP